MRDIARRLAPSFERAAPRQRAMADLQGVLSPAERQNSGQWAEVSGEPPPYGFQHVLGRARWAPEAVRDELRTYVHHPRGDPNAVLVRDETGLLNQGQHSAGVVRQYRGTAGRMAHGQMGVWVGSAGPLGPTWLDRARDRPEAWTSNRERGQRAGLPQDRRVAPPPPLAKRLVARAGAAGVPAKGGTGASGEGHARRRRLWREDRPQASVLAGSRTEDVWLAWPQRQVQTLLATLPEDGWTRRRAGHGATGPRWDDGRGLPLAEPLEPAWRRWRVVRRRVHDTTALRADVVVAPQAPTLEEAVCVAGTRGVIAQRFDAAQGAVGLDHAEVRSWTGWDSADHAREVGAGPLDRAARRAHRRGGIPKKPPASSRAEPPGIVQGPPGPRLPRRVPEIRRLLWHVVFALQQTAQHSVAWSELTLASTVG